MTRLDRLKDALLGLDEEISALEAFTSRGELPPDDVLSTSIIMIGQMRARMQGVLNVKGDVGGSTQAGSDAGVRFAASQPRARALAHVVEPPPDPPWFQQGQFE